MNPLTPEEDKKLQEELRLVENRARSDRQEKGEDRNYLKDI